jgi:hypothetical protein
MTFRTGVMSSDDYCVSSARQLGRHPILMEQAMGII